MTGNDGVNSPDCNAQDKKSRADKWWLALGIVLLASIIALVLCLLIKVEPPGCQKDAKHCPTSEHPTSAVINIGGLVLGKPDTKIDGLDELTEAIGALVTAFDPPLELEVSHDFRNSGLDGIIKETIRTFFEASPIKVEISQPAGCLDGGCSPSIFVSGDLNWSDVEQHTWEVQGKSCQLEWAGRVCGFGVNKWEFPGAHPHLGQTLNEVGQQLANWSLDGRLRALILIGRADRLPSQDATIGGNSGLAQARARTVRDKFKGHSALSEVLSHRTVLIGTGPLNVPTPCSGKDSDCNDEEERRADRGVDVFACLMPGDAADAEGEPQADKASKCGGPAGLRPDRGKSPTNIPS